jgi:hypothetical protein
MKKEEKIAIIFYPLTAGVFLARLLSCSTILFGKSFVKKLKKDYDPNNLIKQDNIRYNELFYPTHPRSFKFEEFKNFKKIIYINYADTDEEKEIIDFRKKFIKSSLNINEEYSELQLKYEKELINYFQKENINFYNFPFISFKKQKDFCNEVLNLFQYLNLEPIESWEIEECHNAWWKLNLKLHHLFLKDEFDGNLLACEFE